MQQKLFLPVLSNFENLFKSKKDCDVTIQTGEGNDQKEIYAHSMVLRCQSTYFEAAFSDNWAKKENGKYIFKKPNISAHILETLIRYLYCGQLDLSTENGSDILKLLIATDEFGLHVLSEYIQEFLTENQKEFLQNDPVGILEIIFQREIFTTLKDNLLGVICREPDILFGIDKILALPVHILETLLLRDDLVLDEIEIWNNLIRWAHAQQHTVNKDPSKWTEDELTLMEGTLSRLIPLIRFHDISSEEYYNMVIPYEDLLPKKLRLEILKFYLVPSVKQIGLLSSRSFHSVDSVLINAKHLSLFVGWIDGENKGLKALKNPYKFNLIFRGSKDGFEASSFHNMCDNKGATIVIAKIKGTNQLVGGYNPIDWNGKGNKNTTDSFIFLFENYNDISTGKIGRVIHKEYAIVCSSSWGPLFGQYVNKSNDLTMNSNCEWSSVKNSYPDINIPRNFEVDDYEVLQVVKLN